MATPGTLIEEGSEEIMLPEDYKRVLRILSGSTSLAFLELSTLMNLKPDRLKVIIDDLAQQGLVKVRNPDDPRDEIVTVKARAASAALAVGAQ